MSTEIVLNAKEYGISEQQEKELLSDLPQIKKERDVLIPQYEEVMKMDIDNPETAKQAKKVRLLIKNNRTKGIATWHKNAKDFFLNGGRFVDSIKRKEIAVNERMEESLMEIENHAQIQEEKRLKALQEERAQILSKYVEDASERDLSGMEEDVWEAYLNTKIKAFEEEEERKRLEEEERKKKAAIDKRRKSREDKLKPLYEFLPKEMPNVGLLSKSEWEDFYSEMVTAKKAKNDEIEAQRIENERLKKEAEERDRLARIEAEKQAKIEAERVAKEEAERKQREEKERKEREAFEAKLKAEREERERIEREEREKREKLEAELRAKKEAEEKARKEEEARIQAELSKGDADKVVDLLNDLEALKTKYTFKSDQNIEMYKKVVEDLDNIIWALS